MQNQIVTQVLDLEAELRKLTKSSIVKATMKVHSLPEMAQAAKDLSVHVFQPFERKDIDVHHFLYTPKGTNILIQVEHTEQYRKKVTLVPV